MPLWVVEVIDAQENARQRIGQGQGGLSGLQPVLPPPAPGSPFTAVEFDEDDRPRSRYVDASRCTGDAKATAVLAARMSLLLQGHRDPRLPSRGISRPASESHRDCGVTAFGAPRRRTCACGSVPGTRWRSCRSRPGLRCSVIGALPGRWSPLPCRSRSRLLRHRSPDFAPAVRGQGVGVRSGGGTPVPGPAPAARRAGPGTPLTAQVEALLDTASERPDLVLLPGGREVTA